MRYLTAVPVYNEAQHVRHVLGRISESADDVLAVDDGSTDGTSDVLSGMANVFVERHHQNRGYGAALRTAFAYALRSGYDWLVTIDCDGQHDPSLIREFLEKTNGFDVISGSRYLDHFRTDSAAPSDRRAINHVITRELNEQFGLALTDAFCGFKAYRVAALRELNLTVDGYAMPLEFWVQAALLGLRVQELAVPRIYLDASRTFGGPLDDPEFRLRHYRDVIRTSRDRVQPTAWRWFCDDIPTTLKPVTSP